MDYHVPYIDKKYYQFVDFVHDTPRGFYIDKFSLHAIYLGMGKYSEWMKNYESAPVMLLYHEDTKQFVVCKIDYAAVRVKMICEHENDAPASEALSIGWRE